MRAIGRILLSLAATAPLAEAGEFRAAPAESRILEFLDRDSDGLLSPAEIDRFPTPMRAWIDENGLSVESDGTVSLDEFGPTLREMLRELREGRFSQGAERRPTSSTGSAPKNRAATSAGTSDRTAGSPDSRRTADYIFQQMDRNRDGKLDRSEWYRSQTVRPWFEDEGIRFTDPMTRASFISYMVKLAERVQ